MDIERLKKPDGPRQFLIRVQNEDEQWRLHQHLPVRFPRHHEGEFPYEKEVTVSTLRGLAYAALQSPFKSDLRIARKVVDFFYDEIPDETTQPEEEPNRTPVEERTHELATEAAEKAALSAKEFLADVQLPGYLQEYIVQNKSEVAYSDVVRARVKGELNDFHNRVPGITVYFNQEMVPKLEEFCKEKFIDLNAIGILNQPPDGGLTALYLPDGMYNVDDDWFPKVEISYDHVEKRDGVLGIRYVSVIDPLKTEDIEWIEGDDGSLFIAKLPYL